MLPEQTPFVQELCKYHHEILNGDIYAPENYRLRENLGYLIESLTNINTPAKQDLLNELCACFVHYNRLITAAVRVGDDKNVCKGI